VNWDAEDTQKIYWLTYLVTTYIGGLYGYVRWERERTTIYELFREKESQLFMMFIVLQGIAFISWVVGVLIEYLLIEIF
jgi:hypothetical protein